MNANLYTTLMLLGLLPALVGCGGGGGGGGGSAAPTNPPIASGSTVPSQTPAGFNALSSDGSVEHDYHHLKSTDINAAAGTPKYDVCANDANQAALWSDAHIASLHLANVAKVSSSETPWYFDSTWSYTSSGTPHLRSERVFNCANIDRSVYDWRNPAPLQAVIQARPVDANTTRYLAEYLWNFSPNNNAGHLVTASVTSATVTGFSHLITEAVYDPAAANTGACVTVTEWGNNYQASTVTGALTLERTVQRTFSGKLTAQGFVGC